MTTPRASPVWDRYRKAAQEHTLPVIRVTGAPLPKEAQLPRMVKTPVRTTDHDHPYAHHRTTTLKGTKKVQCLRRGCHNTLHINDLLCCSPECEAELRRIATKILEVFDTRPARVYVDTFLPKCNRRQL